MTREEYISKEDYTFYENKNIWSKTKKRFLKGYINPKGYVQVWLKCTDGKIREFLWHRVIWFVFNGKIPQDMQVNHINEDKTDNRLCNLNLMTPKENTNHGTRNQRIASKLRGIPRHYVTELKKGRKLSEEHKRKISESHINNPLLSKQVVAVKDNVIVMEFASICEAGRNGFSHSAVCACCRNCYMREGNNFYKGYRWYFKSELLAMQKQIASPHRREDAIQLELNLV